MFLVYLQEAHPARLGEQTTTGPFGPDVDPFRSPVVITEHRNLDDRAFAASVCVEQMKLTLPILIDTMDGTTKQNYGVTFGATAVVDLDGKLAYYWEGTGVQPAGAAKVLERLLRHQPATTETKSGDRALNRPSVEPSNPGSAK